jgi:mRNA interferase YafQ
MRTIERTTQFKKDYRREKKGRHGKDLDDRLEEVLYLLVIDKPLPGSKVDHPLRGHRGMRECHLKPDLLLIYSMPGKETLQLIRLGSHSELFG